MRSSLSQVSALRDSLNYCLMVSSESGAEISFRKSVLTASIKRFVFTRKYRTLVSFSLRCSRTKVEQEKFQVAAYAAARFFFRFAVNVKQPIQPTCDSLFFWFINCFEIGVNSSMSRFRLSAMVARTTPSSDKTFADSPSCITSLEAVARTHSSFAVWGLYEPIQNQWPFPTKLDLPIGEHHQAILFALVRLESFFQQVNLVTATLKVHVTTLPWLIQSQRRHLNNWHIC